MPLPRLDRIPRLPRLPRSSLALALVALMARRPLTTCRKAFDDSNEDTTPNDAVMTLISMVLIPLVYVGRSPHDAVTAVTMWIRCRLCMHVKRRISATSVVAMLISLLRTRLIYRQLQNPFLEHALSLLLHCRHSSQVPIGTRAPPQVAEPVPRALEWISGAHPPQRSDPAVRATTRFLAKRRRFARSSGQRCVALNRSCGCIARRQVRAGAFVCKRSLAKRRRFVRRSGQQGVALDRPCGASRGGRCDDTFAASDAARRMRAAAANFSSSVPTPVPQHKGVAAGGDSGSGGASNAAEDRSNREPAAAAGPDLPPLPASAIGLDAALPR